MNDIQFEQLLFEEESTTLDFKVAQYKFVGEDKEEKSEILKDILGFANAWRRSEAFILIGVEEVRGGRSNEVGINHEDHLDDHSLQQFVNSKTNCPVHFRYEAFGTKGLQIGVIHFDQKQHRPVYLLEKYGRLKKNEVYVRRSSSTDISKPATPDEIAHMGQQAPQKDTELVVEFADVQRELSLGTTIAAFTEFCKMPDDAEIPAPSAPTATLYDAMNRPNQNYFSELAEWEFTRRAVTPIRFLVRNVGTSEASNVRVELSISAGIGIGAMMPHEMPDAPEYRQSIYDVISPRIGPLRNTHREPGDLSIDRNAERVKLEIECGHLQPGRCVWSDDIRLCKRDSGQVLLNGHIFAGNLSTPKAFTLSVDFDVAQTEMSVEELLNLPRPSES